MLWPYRPRVGYPPAPLWLVVPILALGVLLLPAVLALLGANPDPTSRNTPIGALFA